VETKTKFMVVKIRFGRGPVVTRRKGKNARIALLAASFLTLIAICFTALGLWRLGQDVDISGGFVFTDGIFSHWQVWIFAAVATQYGAWRLKVYSKVPRESESSEDASPEASAQPRVTAKV
jgi:hypothetical protein